MTNEAKFTKGIWQVFHVVAGGHHTTAIMLGDTKREIIAWPGFDSSYFQKDNLANAHLIAASPTMYAYIAKKAEEGDAEAKSIIANNLQVIDHGKHSTITSSAEPTEPEKALVDDIELAVETIALKLKCNPNLPDIYAAIDKSESRSAEPTAEDEKFAADFVEVFGGFPKDQAVTLLVRRLGELRAPSSSAPEGTTPRTTIGEEVNRKALERLKPTAPEGKEA